MNLIQVLDKFPTEINNEIESIEYDGDATAYKITATFADDELEGEYQHIEIILFDSGESMLYVVNTTDDNPLWVWDNVLDFYQKVRTIWKNVV